MKFTLHTSSIMPMLGFLEDLRNNHADRNVLRAILDHPDYDFEFRRYGIASKEPFINYLMQLNTIKEQDIPEADGENYKDMFRVRHKHWLDVYENPGKYKEMLDKLLALMTDEALDKARSTAINGLADDMETDHDIKVISTLSIGRSFGYAHEGGMHFDLIGFKTMRGGIESFPGILAHEVFYTFGNDLYGSIYDIYGKAVLFECVRNPLKALELFKVITKDIYKT